MELYGATYPYPLGRSGKNSLTKKGSFTALGRWVNVNHEDWSNPEWARVQCTGYLVDRSLGPKRYAEYDTDVAVMTEYEDPVLNMMVYDMVPAKSMLFDMEEQPPNNLDANYDWATYDFNLGDFNRGPQIIVPLRPLNFMIPLVGLGAVYQYLKRLGLRNDNL